MTKSKYLILGGGMVAGYAAKEMVERGLKAGELSIISADDAIPYERPPLSKGFLAGKEEEEKIRINPEGFYREHGIDLKLGVEVAGVDVAKKVLRLRSGDEAGFEKLVIATGAAVQDPGHSRRHTCPGSITFAPWTIRSAFGRTPMAPSAPWWPAADSSRWRSRRCWRRRASTPR